MTGEPTVEEQALALADEVLTLRARLRERDDELDRLRAENAALTAIADAATHWLDHWEDVHEDEDDCSFCLGARVGLNEALRDALAARPSTDTPAADDTVAWPQAVTT